MVTRTDATVISQNSSNPQFLIDAMVRSKIYNSRYWKENCMGLTAESLIDEAIQLKYVAACYGAMAKPSKFITLVQKMLQIGPETEIVLELIHNAEYKYITCLAMFYFRLVCTCQEQLFLEFEKLYTDYRKIRIKNVDGTFQIKHIDDYVHMLLNNDIVLGIALPRIQRRMILEELGKLQPRVSLLEKELEAELKKEEEEMEKLKLQEEQEQEEHEKIDKEKEKEKDDEEFEKKHKKKHKHKKEKHWKKVVKGKHHRHSRSKSQKRSRSPKKAPQAQKLTKEEEEMAEWNRIRAEIGAQPLPQ